VVRRSKAGRWGGVALIVGALGSSPAAAQDPAGLYELVRPAPHLLVAQTREGVPASGYAAAIAVMGRDGVLVVDTHHGPTAANWMISQINAETIAPVRWVVNTHAHGDHHWGNSAYRSAFPQARILAHPATIDSVRNGATRALQGERDRLEARSTRIANALRDGQVLPAARPDWEAELERAEGQFLELARIRVVVADSAVDQPTLIDLGGVTARVEPGGPAHTPGDLIVWVDDQTVIVGDLLEEGVPWLGGSDVRGWSATLDRIVAAGPSLVIASHGGIMELGELDLHARVLRTAVRVSDAAPIADRDRTLREMAPLVEELVAGGVGRETAEAYVVEAVERATPAPGR